nr:peptide deformylase [uncultured Oscillibacter sp.]
MVREIVTDPILLSRRAEPAGVEDLETARDLLDTLAAHREDCVGMAANMIGVNRRVIVFENEGEDMVMFNPEIIRESGPYEAEEGCLSLPGTRRTRRWQTIQVRYQNELFQTRTGTYTALAAEIIQHEIDHCEGILI